MMSNTNSAATTSFEFSNGLFAGRTADQIYEPLKAIAHPLRLKILCLISRKKAANVSEIVALLDTSQSNVSQHLRVLRNGGVVGVRRENNCSYYRIISPAIIKIIGNQY